MNLRSLFTVIIIMMITSCSGKQSQVADNSAQASFTGDSVSELSSKIFCMYQDSKGNYWFGSIDQGTYKYDGKRLIRYTTEDGLYSNRIESIQEDKKGNILIATSDGVVKYNGNEIIRLIPIKSIRQTDYWQLNADDLWFYLPGADGERLPARYDGEKLYSLEIPHIKLEEEYYQRFKGNPPNPYSVYTIYKDLEGMVWFGTANFGACRYDGKGFKWLYEDHLTNTPEGGSFGIRSILEDADHKFWFSNTQYRYTIYPDSAGSETSFIPFKREKGIEGITSVNNKKFTYYLSILQTKKGDIWMATYDEGVWYSDGKISRQYLIKDGTSNAKLFKVYCDHSGNIWVTSESSGVLKFDGRAFLKFNP